jgi:hypothetical protein
MPDRNEMHQRWLRFLTVEHERRSGVADGKEAAAWLVAELDKMAERLQVAADYEPLSEAESAALSAELDEFFDGRR